MRMTLVLLVSPLTMKKLLDFGANYWLGFLDFIDFLSFLSFVFLVLQFKYP